MGSVEDGAGELDAAEEEAATQSAENILLLAVIAWASGYGTGVTKSESGITKPLKDWKTPKKMHFYHCDLGMHSDWNRKHMTSTKQCPVLL